MPRRKPDLIQVAMSDPRFRLLSFAEAGFWVHLMHLLLESPTPGRVCFLGSVFGSVSRLVSVSEPVTETEVETHLATFEKLGLIEFDAQENALWLQGAKDACRRTEAARINGKNGGRKRKGDTEETYWARRQGNMILPIAGGLQETHGTEAEPSRESSRAATSSNPILEEKVSTAGEEAWVSLKRQVAEIASLDASRLQNSEPVFRQWLGLPGATVEGICDAVRRVVTRSKFDASKRVPLGYFTPAVIQHLAEAPAAALPGFNPDSYAAEKLRVAKMAWAQNPVGPMPRRAA